MTWPPRTHVAVLCVVTLVVTAAIVEAQFGRRFSNTRIATPDDIDGAFHFCRVAFTSDPRGGADGGWNVDWPRADINLSVRLSELTKTFVSRSPGGEPKHWLIRLTDDMLFECPFVMMTEVGSASLSEPEATRLREYLLKGGFLWADDFWGTYSWNWWNDQLQRVLPPSEFPVVTRATASARARSCLRMKAPDPVLTSMTIASKPAAPFFEMIEATINGIAFFN